MLIEPINIRKKIIIDELERNTRPVPVEDVIFWALSLYAVEFQDCNDAGMVAAQIIESINLLEKPSKEKIEYYKAYREGINTK